MSTYARASRRQTHWCTGLLSVVALASVVAACDTGGAEDKLPKSLACTACHLSEYEGVTHPMHPGKKPKTCAVCHKETSWSPAILKHEWPLTGAHKKANCFACHSDKPPVFEGTPNECVDCHRDDFVHVKFAAHAKFSKQCDDCHSTTAWKPTLDGTHTEATPKPEPTPKPVPTQKPVPTPKPVPTQPVYVPPKPIPKPIPKPTTSPPDVITHPSGR